MARVLVQIVLPLLLPFAIYAGWVAVRQHQLARLGRGEGPSWADAPWIWLLALGALLALAASFGLSQHGGAAPGVYVPARLGPDGQMIPGRIEPRQP
jgi:hypothetical protein